MKYASCPLHWASQCQTKITLSTTESKFIGLSMALYTTIPIMETTKELHKLGFQFGSTMPTVHHQVFEDTSGVIEIVTIPKIWPCTKHINVKYHHFWDYIDWGKITVNAIDSNQQPADMLTKLVLFETLCRYQFKVMGWGGRSNIGSEYEETKAGDSGPSSNANALMNPPQDSTKDGNKLGGPSASSSKTN